jgi:hypothetical protein
MSEEPELVLEVTNKFSNFYEWLFFYRVGRNLSDQEIKHMRQAFESQQVKINEQAEQIHKLTEFAHSMLDKARTDWNATVEIAVGHGIIETE